MPSRAHVHAPAHTWYAKKQDTARPSSGARGYGRRWQAYAAAYLANHPICARCRGPVVTLRRDGKPDRGHVDHVEPVTGPDDPLFWDEDNHQPLCAPCHGIKSQTEDRGKGRAKA